MRYPDLGSFLALTLWNPDGSPSTA
jgi:hypothetical protein